MGTLESGLDKSTKNYAVRIITSIISLVVSFFDSGIRIYEKNNTGWWYDLGYYMAVISGFGSLALSRRQKSSNQR